MDPSSVSPQELELYKERVARLVCRKRRYPSQTHAEGMLRVCIEAGRAEKRSYRCTMCGGWHLTSSVNDERRSR